MNPTRCDSTMKHLKICLYRIIKGFEFQDEVLEMVVYYAI